MRKGLFLLVLGFVMLVSPCGVLLAAEGDVVVSGRVTSEDGSGIAGATVSIAALNVSATTDRSGRYTLRVPAASVQGQAVEVRVVAPGAQSKTARVTLAAGTVAQDFVLPLSFQQEVTVGSRALGTAAEKAVPVDILTEKQIETASGSAETAQIIESLAPSFNFPRPTISDGTDSVRPATLRSLGPDQMLVLINGKRRHTSALLNINGSVGRGTSAVDINLIPTIALSRVEVLRDGAAAQYGSDAIAGVINFQLRSARSGGRASATYGQYYTRVDDVQTYNGVVTGPGNTPVLAPDGTLQLDYTGNDRKRHDGQTVTLAGVIGLPIMSDGFVDIAAEFQSRDATNRTGADPTRQYNLIAGAFDPRELTFNRFSHRYGDADTKDYKIFINGAVPLGGSGTEVYSFASYNKRDGESAGFYRTASNSRNVPAIYPDGFLPLITTDTKDYAGTLGVRGDLMGWRWDLSGQYGQDKVDFTIKNTLNASLGATSPLEFDSGGLKYDQSLFNLDISRELAFAKKTTVSLGGEYRRERFDIRPGELNSYVAGPIAGPSGAQVFPGFQPVIGGASVDQPHKRHNVSVYGEVDSDINDIISVQAALRYEDYSDFGSDLNWKISGRIEPTPGIAIRASASTGFRAPSLQQQFYAARATNNVAGVLLETVTLPVDNPVAIALGATPLDPEQSKSLSAGIVFSAIPRLNVTVDAYRIDIDDRIVVTDNLTATRDAARNPTGPNPGFSIAQILNAAGFNFVDAARFFVNGVDTRTKGVDFVATYRVPQFAGGRLNLTGGFNYNKTKIKQLLAAPGPLANVPNLVLFGRQESLRLVKGQPTTKVNLSADYDREWLGFTLRTTRYGKVLDAGAPASGVQDIHLGAKWITDAELRAKPLGDRYVFALGVNNLFDTYPTNTPLGRVTDPVSGAQVNLPASRYVTPFSNFSPFGFNGRYIYGRLAVEF
jgi:iron complex outermembrane receptor protein